MRLNRLKLVNFRQHVESELVFGPGVTAIIGPNGAGKTTLLEAIAWALYGAPAVRGGRESLRWNRAPARAPVRVELEFGMGAHEYRVVRGLYQAELYQDGGERPVANSQQEVTAKLERVLGMSREEFFNTYFTNQKELAVMARMGPADRARFLSKILGYEKLREAQDLVRLRRSELKAQQAGTEQGLGDERVLQEEHRAALARLDEARRRVREAERRKADAERRLADVGPAWSRMATLRESVLSLDGERRLAMQRVEEARRDFERLDRELAQALEAQGELKRLAPQLDAVRRLRAELEQLDREAQAADRRRALAGQLKEVDSQIERVERRLHELEGVEAQARAAEAALEAAHAELARAEEEAERARTAWVRDRQDAQTKLDATRQEYRDLQEHLRHIQEAGPDGTCPTCLRPLGAEYAAVVGTLSRQLEALEVNGKYYRQRVEQLAEEPAAVREAAARAREAAAALAAALEGATQARERLRDREELLAERRHLADRRADLQQEAAALPDRYDVERHEAVRLELKALEPAVVLEAQLRVVAERAARLVGEAEAAERTLSQREQHLAELTAAIAAAGYREEAFIEARERYEAAERAVREAQLDLTTVRGDARGAEQLVEMAERRLAERAARAELVERLKREIRLHDELDRALGDLRTDLNAQMRPELAELASAFLAELTDGRYQELELDEDYDLLVLEDGVAKRVISGGEEDIAHLVLRLAISQMVAERAGQPLSLLVLDEVFGSLDESRREHVISLLRHLGDRFPQVVLITHVEAIRAGVDRVLRVSFDPGRGAAVVSEDPGTPQDVAA
jgi:exonuclease SbcC